MTVEELQKSGKAIEEIVAVIWKGLAEDFGGAAVKSMDSWQGLTATFKSYVIEIQRQVMAEAGVDISAHRSKHVDELKDIDFDCVVTVCGHAREHCPVLPGKAKTVHVGFGDPPALAGTARNEEEALAHYRRVRDEIKAFVQALPEILEDKDRKGR